MVATVKVAPVVYAGTCNGGEDLFLKFTCEVDGDTVPTSFDVEFITDDDFAECSVSCLDADAEDRSARTGEPYRSEWGVVTYRGEFEWGGNGDDALRLVADRLRNSKAWRFCHCPGEAPRLRFEHLEYIAGNAD